MVADIHSIRAGNIAAEALHLAQVLQLSWTLSTNAMPTAISDIVMLTMGSQAVHPDQSDVVCRTISGRNRSFQI